MPPNHPIRLFPLLVQILLLLSASSLLLDTYDYINLGINSSFSYYYFLHLLTFLSLHLITYKILSQRASRFFARMFADCPSRLLPSFCTFLTAHLLVNLTYFVWGKVVLLIFTGSVFRQALTEQAEIAPTILEGVKEFAASAGVKGEKVVEEIKDFASSVGVPSEAVSHAAKVVTSAAAKISGKVADVVKSAVVEVGKSIQEAARTNDTASAILEKVAKLVNATVATPKEEL